MLHFTVIVPYAAALCMVTSISLIAGCTNPDISPMVERSDPPLQIPEPPQSTSPVVRSGRYALVERVPDPTQQDLMQQFIEINLPGAWAVSVEDALRYVLLRSGYQLCTLQGDASSLAQLPLPAAHLRLGPLSLHDSLLTLVGPGWDMQVNDMARAVCFSSRIKTVLPAPDVSERLP